MLFYGNNGNSDSPFLGTGSKTYISNGVSVGGITCTDGMVTAMSIIIGSSRLTEVFRTKLPTTLISSGFAYATEYFKSLVG